MAIYAMAKRKKPCDVPSRTTFFAKKSRPGIGPSIYSSTSMSSVRVPIRCEVESSVFTTLGDVSPVAEYDVGKLLDMHMDLKELSLKYNCLLKMEPSSNSSS